MTKVTTMAEARRCRVRITIAGVGNNWTLLIFHSLGGAPQSSQRYMELSRAIPTISRRSLTQALRDMERDGYVARKVHPTSPPKVEYRLTALGKSLLRPMRILVLWASEHLEEVVSARREYDKGKA